jgi:hypothetical protein
MSMAKKEKHMTFFELKDALAKNVCPICFLAQRSATRYIGSLLYEKVNDAGLAGILKQSGGFCKEHAREVLETEEAVGIAIIYKRIIDDLLGRLRKSLKPPIRKQCPVCSVCDESEAMYLNALKDHWDELKSLFGKSSGLCVSHFYMAIGLMKQEEKSRELRSIQMQKLDELSKELGEFFRKHDYRYKDEAWGKEKDSWQRAIRLINRE